MIRKDTADELRLAERVDATRDAKQRDRYRVVLIAARGLGNEASCQMQGRGATEHAPNLARGNQVGSV